IDIAVEEKSRILTISDNGIGMTKDELENNLGTIARSGSLDFAKDKKDCADIDIIGQFGVGFYSAFMVADKIRVTSRAFGFDEAWVWESAGAEGYTLSEGKKLSNGTVIELEIKKDSDNDKFGEFLNRNRLSALVKKYSDYIRYPIKLDMEHSVKKEGEEDKYETVLENTVLNTMVPLWKKNKKDIKEEEYNSFYHDKFFDYTDPLKVIHQKAEGTTQYEALLYIPENAEYNYYTKDFERGLQLYSSGVMIMEKCPMLLPEYFGFVKGLVDSEDLSLNISREMLQHDRQLALIRTALEKRIKKELVEMLEKDRESYKKFFSSFGLTLKFGIYKSYGAARDNLEELLLFKRAFGEEPVTLKEYADAMPEGQKYIYYAAGENAEKLAQLPQTELLRDRGYDILFLTDDVDEFLMSILHDYSKKEFRSVSSEDLDVLSEEEKGEKAKQNEDNKELFDCMKEALCDKVESVRLSSRLKSHPVCLTTEGALSLEMEKLLNDMPNGEKVKAKRILEVNGDHEVFTKLVALWPENKEQVKKYAELLYDQALLIEGMSIEDPVRFSNLVCELMK
ncbi:MAG: molecular chaperone HtpG, partial [Oscillospiraceae bacterium]